MNLPGRDRSQGQSHLFFPRPCHLYSQGRSPLWGLPAPAFFVPDYVQPQVGLQRPREEGRKETEVVLT